RVAVALGVDVLHRPGGGVDALDAAADVVGRLQPRGGHTVELRPHEAAVLADVDLAVGADGGAVGAASRLGHLRHRAVGCDSGERAGLDLHDDDAAVLHRDRPFGEAQASGHPAQLCHVPPPCGLGSGTTL